MLCGKRCYEPPMTTVIKLEAFRALLVASNEGLGYEDLFSSQESVIYEEEPIKSLF